MRIAQLLVTGARTRTLLKLLDGRTMCSKASNKVRCSSKASRI